MSTAKRRRNQANPRVRIHADGRATLAGLDYSDLKSILTSAWLWRSQEAEKRTHGRKKDCHCEECSAWTKAQLVLIDLARASVDKAIRGTFPPGSPPSKAQRFATVRETKRFRLVMDEMFADMDREREAREAAKKTKRKIRTR